MKILHRNNCRLYEIKNMTPKMRHIIIHDGSIIVFKILLKPMDIYDFRSIPLHLSHDLRISGQGSRGAHFDGVIIDWPIIGN